MWKNSSKMGLNVKNATLSSEKERIRSKRRLSSFYDLSYIPQGRIHLVLIIQSRLTMPGELPASWPDYFNWKRVLSPFPKYVSGYFPFHFLIRSISTIIGVTKLIPSLRIRSETEPRFVTTPLWPVPIQTTGLKIKTNPNTFIQCFLRNAKTYSIMPLLFLEKIHVRDSQKRGQVF